MEDEDDCSGGLFKSFYVGSCRSNVLEDQRKKNSTFQIRHRERDEHCRT
jgi:hypothetical protein